MKPLTPAQTAEARYQFTAAEIGIGQALERLTDAIDATAILNQITGIKTTTTITALEEISEALRKLDRGKFNYVRKQVNTLEEDRDSVEHAYETVATAGKWITHASSYLWYAHSWLSFTPAHMLDDGPYEDFEKLLNAVKQRGRQLSTTSDNLASLRKKITRQINEQENQE
ncbi:MAG: hypothetical protein Q4D87_08880 [Actinomycetaceae bacterium]|nr:hypothetical protein [Actinomycetaceae bacterium]